MKKLLFFIITALLIESCAQVPLTGRRQVIAVPSSEIIPLAEKNYTEIISEEGLSKNTQYQASVKRVGTKLSAAVEKYLNEQGLGDRVADYKWEFKVLASDQVNAWCMPGGKIGFYEGIMPICKDDNGIAVVMSHEIAHAVALHSNERMSQQLMINLGGAALSEAVKTQSETTQNLALVAFGLGSQVGVLLPYSRLHESEADELGLYFMAMAGYDPQEAPIFWERMNEAGGERPPEFLSTHPNPDNRIKDLNKNMKKALEYYNQ